MRAGGAVARVGCGVVWEISGGVVWVGCGLVVAYGKKRCTRSLTTSVKMCGTELSIDVFIGSVCTGSQVGIPLFCIYHISFHQEHLDELIT
jgi:hypothetical protein